MKTRIVHTKVWTDSTFVDLSKNGKLLFLYLISNEYIGLTGAYEISTRLISFNTGLTPEEIVEAKKELDKPLVFLGEWVLIRNHNKYNNYSSNIMQKKAYVREYEKVPEELRKYLTKIELPAVNQILVSDQTDTSIIPDRNKKQESINHKEETINKNNDAPKKTLDQMKMEIGKPMTGISTQWQDDAFRHAEYLGIDLKKNASLKPRWLGFYKRSFPNKPLYSRVQQALSFLKDYTPYQSVTTAEGKMRYFFDVVQNYEKYHKGRG